MITVEEEETDALFPKRSSAALVLAEHCSEGCPKRTEPPTGEGVAGSLPMALCARLTHAVVAALCLCLLSGETPQRPGSALQGGVGRGQDKAAAACVPWLSSIDLRWRQSGAALRRLRGIAPLLPATPAAGLEARPEGSQKREARRKLAQTSNGTCADALLAAKGQLGNTTAADADALGWIDAATPAAPAPSSSAGTATAPSATPTARPRSPTSWCFPTSLTPPIATSRPPRKTPSGRLKTSGAARLQLHRWRGAPC